MAKQIKTDHILPVFYWGQNYMGPLTSILAVATQFVSDKLNMSQLVFGKSVPYVLSPASLSIATSLQFAIATVLLGSVVVRFFSVLSLILFYSIFLIGTNDFNSFSIITNGPEMAYLMGAIIFCLFAHQKKDSRYFWLGLSVGLGWWFNQSIIFIFSSILLFVFFTNEQCFKFLKPFLKIQNYFKTSNRIETTIRTFAIILLIAGIFINFYAPINTIFHGKRIKIFNGTSTIKIGIYFFIILNFINQLKEHKTLMSEIKNFIIKNKAPLLGFMLGFAPVWLGGIFGLYEKFYGIKTHISPWPFLIEQIPHIITITIPGMIQLPVIYSWVFIISLGFIIYRFGVKLESNTINVSNIVKITFLCFVLNIVYMLLSERAYFNRSSYYFLQSLPYLVISFLGVIEISKGLVSKTILFCVLMIWQFQLFKSSMFLSGNSKFNVDNSKLSKLVTNLNAPIICEGNYWQVYHSEFFSDGMFMGYSDKDSQDRTPKRSLKLKQISQNEKKCTINNNYEIVY